MMNDSHSTRGRTTRTSGKNIWPWLVVGALATSVACGGSANDSSGAAATNGSGTGGQGASRGTGGAGGGGDSIASGGSLHAGGGGHSSGGTGDGACCEGGCVEACPPASTRVCGDGRAQNCNCDGTGWSGVHSTATTGGSCSVYVQDAGHAPSDASADDAASDGAPSAADGGTYCVFESSGTGGSSSNYCVPLPKGCASCGCIPLPQPTCNCYGNAQGISVTCFGV